MTIKHDFTCVDSVFIPGQSHLDALLPCQDYSFSGHVPPVSCDNHPFAIISDGCSTMGRMKDGVFIPAKTDVGARIVAHTFSRSIPNNRAYDSNLLQNSAWQAECIMSPNFWNSDDLMATLGAVYINRSGSVTALMLGDGVIAVKFRNGVLHVVDVDWVASMPPYVAYLTSDESMTQFRAASAKAGLDAEREPCIVRTTDTRFDPDGGEIRSFERYIFPELDAASNGLWFDYIANDVECIAVFSDGIKQVTSTSDQHTVLPLIDAVGQCMTFPSARKGDFVHRHLRRVLQTWKRDGYAPNDDLSMGAISIMPSS